MSTAATTSPSTWAPLRSPLYRALWMTQLASNLGTWMQMVGAQWLMVDEPNAATLVALIQTAISGPVMLLAIPSGVLADLLDRRRLLLGAQSAMAITAAILTVSTALGHTTPTVLLTLLFLMGCGQALTAPAWQAIQPELVPRDQIASASALGSMGFNIGRAVGPALAGLLVSLTGPTVVFGVNALSFAGIVVVLASWRRDRRVSSLPAERPFAAMQAGTRFIRAAPAIRRVLTRVVLFVVPASAVWALLPVVAHDRLALDADGYGVMLGALGVGAVLGALGLSRVRRWLTPTQRLAVSGLLFCGGAVGCAWGTNLAVVVGLLTASGLAWMLTMATLNATMQLLLPGWVRARGLSVYLLTFMGCQAVAGALWGVLAGAVGISSALLIAAGLLLLCALSTVWLPIRHNAEFIDLSPAVFWPEPQVVTEPDPTDGPVLVLRGYDVPPENVAEFLEAMSYVGRSRQRTGAMEWRVYRDIGAEDRYVEAFVVRSWAEHMHQHQVRLTAQDQIRERAAARYTTGDYSLTHLVAVRPQA